MDAVSWLVKMVDGFLIAPYRWPQDHVAGWWLGTFILALWSTILGQLTLAVAFRINRGHVSQAVQEMEDRHNQSINALRAGDNKAYRAINKLANEAFGKSFFLQLAMACSSLWPPACALWWLSTRFSQVRFDLPFSLPGIGDSVGYAFIFIPLYVLVRILSGKVKTYLSFAKQ